MDKKTEERKSSNETQKEEARLKSIGWIAFGISLSGIIFNAWKIIWCWPIWILANCFWTYWAIKKKEWPQVFLWIIFSLANFYGWYMWLN